MTDSTFLLFYCQWRAKPHYGWGDVVGDSSQLLSIQPQERPPGVFPNIDFGTTPQKDEQPELPPS